MNGETPPEERLETIRKNKVVIISRVGGEGLSLSNIDWTIEYDYLGQSRRQGIQRADTEFPLGDPVDCGIEPFVRPDPTAGDESLALQAVRPFPEDVATGKRLSGGTAGQGR